MLPPTKGLLTLDYAEAVKSLNNYKRDHQAPDGHTINSSTVSSDAENGDSGLTDRSGVRTKSWTQ